MESWRPIDTAPKDGSSIFVCRRVGTWNVYGTAHWAEAMGIGGWISRALFDPPGVLGLGSPTHWQPMFQPPEALQPPPEIGL